MYISPFSILISLPHLITLVSAAANPIGPNPNDKRGLVYVPSKDHPEDDKIWIQSGSPLTWYYNYQSKPSPSLEGGPTNLQFIPMLWGDYDNTFVQDVKDLVDQGYDIQYVLGFNEPDIPAGTGAGGSGVSPENAAARWKESIEPLAKMGIKLGAPAVTGAPGGLTWMKAFFEACDTCTVDFIPLHWYGNFDGVASHLGTYSAAFPNMTFWLTEFAFAHQDVTPSQEFFNLTMEYFDRLDNVGKYSWFGSFRSDVSNVGPNSALLNEDGGLTYIGAWYLNKDESEAASITGKGGSGNNAPALGASIMKSFGVTAFVAVAVSWIL
ncbi:hypothetical protein TWF718_009601 [Orbilia javanica]|uniref:Asl1-like glycosyl hydrolase catalytic domain-containing protein n=1 Tax=Orbilia javanica TaxID=47235 RepID=A0AAN8MQ32_9PEZI